MKKIIGVTGSMKDIDSSSEYLLSIALDAAAEHGVETELVRLKDYNILPCSGCGRCMNGEHCPLLERPDDQYKELFDKMVCADGFIFSSPVYALSLPAIWKNWIDRCEPCDDKDLNFKHYNYDRVNMVKGKALKGKVAGQIILAAGLGHEWAMSCLQQAFICVKLSMVVSVGISLIEYDGQPGIKKRNWSKPIQDAEFAKQMARGVGSRVATSIGYSHFDDSEIYRPNRYLTIQEILVSDIYDEKISLSNIITDEQPILIVGTQESSQKSLDIYKGIDNDPRFTGKSNFCALVGTLPHFITTNFIKEKISSIFIGDNSILFDWDNNIEKFKQINGKIPCLIVKTGLDTFEAITMDDQKSFDELIFNLDKIVCK